MTAARAGDGDAFAAIMRRHYPDCLRFAMRMLGNKPDAEDAVQETFIRAYRSLDRYRESDRFKPWLFRILSNRCRSQLSRHSALRRMIERYGSRAPAAAMPTVSDGDDRFVTNALMQLPPKLREAFVLKFVDQLEYEEMRAVTGSSVSALKMRVQRARESLRKILGDGYAE